MTRDEFLKLSNDLQHLASIIPLKWGSVQNNAADSKLNMFKIHTYEDLETHIEKFEESLKNYFRRRWFLWKCAQCDEYIFCLNKNVLPNPNQKDQLYDIEFNKSKLLQFDIKGTVIPVEFRSDIPALIQNPEEMICFFYEKQSGGVRKNIQNRLFIVHHSFISQEREMYIRCQWDFKLHLFKEYAQNISPTANFINYKSVKADVVFIFENVDKTISANIFSIQ